MRKFNLFKTVATSVVAVAAGLIIGGGSVHAIPYTGDTTVASPVPAFNVFTGVDQGVGNESDFLRARAPINGQSSDATTQYVDPLNTACTDGEIVQMRVYVHNGASKDNNPGVGDGSSVAHGTVVKVSLPGNTGTTFQPSAMISATNASTVNDNVTINCGGGKQVKLTYVAGSASQYSKGSGVVALSDSIVTSGVPVRSEQTPGDVWGCWDERVYVVLSVKVEVVPVTPPPSTGVCVAPTVSTIDNRSIRVTVQAKTDNAKVIGYKIDFGDGTTSNKQTDQHTYADKTASYQLMTYVQIQFADNTTKWVNASDCNATIKVTNNTPPQVTPPPTTTTTTTPPPAQLLNTGPGQVAALFAGASIAGIVAHRLITRRFGRQS